MRLQEKGVKVPSRQAIPRRSGEGPWPLSYAQQRLWFLDQLDAHGDTYNIPAAARLEGPLDVGALEQSLNEIVRRHESLRTVFSVVDGRPVQVILRGLTLPLPLTDLRTLREAERWAEVRRRTAAEAKRPFDLARGPLLRASLLRLAEDEHVILLTMHHIISDAWSMGVLIRELGALYAAYARGEESPLAELPVQYADYAAWQREWLRGETLEEHLAYWKRHLAGAADVLQLPTDRPRPAAQSFDGAAHNFALSPDLARALKALCQREDCTLFMLLLAAFNVLLHRYTGQEDICVGTVEANRNCAEVEPLIGFFVNTLALRTRLDGDPTFRALLVRTRHQLLEAHPHREAPFEKLVEELRPERSLGHAPLFQVMLVLQNAPQVEARLPGLTLSLLEVERATAKFDLTLMVSEDGDGLSACFEYSTDLFDGATIERLASHFGVLLSSVVADPDARLSDLPLLAEEERRLLLFDFNDTRRPLSNSYAHEMFEQQVRRTPDAVAVECNGETLTYAELDERANQLARRLGRLGVGPEVRVALLLERSVEMVVSVLAVLKAGGAYVPLESACPPERLRFMLEDSGASVILTNSALDARLPAGAAARSLRLDVDGVQPESETDDDPGLRPDASCLCYVIYTSGSTGEPKGVMVTHGGLSNYLHWAREAYGVGPGRGAPVHSPLSFDLTVTALLLPLAAGGSVTLLPEGRGVEQLAATLASPGGYNLVKLTPAHLEALSHCLPAESASEAAQVLVVGGEALTWSSLSWWGGHAPDLRVVNEYGPTETVVGCCVESALAGEADGAEGAVPIGRPIANTRLYVLGPRGEVVPAGVSGELYIGGEGLARGYLNRPGMTAERFVPDPFSGEAGARLYRTGDVVKYLADGRLEYVGRADQQVKVRGFRVELGEIEAALSEHLGVREAAVSAREEGGHKRLVAYVVARGARGELSSTELRRFLSERLPEYMIPSLFVELDELPLTRNGKVDRKALPAPDRSLPGSGYTAPRTREEELLCEVWREVLGVERVGLYDNFFELGGDSILSIQVVSRAARRGLHLTPRQLFQHQTVAELAVAASSPTSQAVLRNGVDARRAEAPPTPIQRWFFEHVTGRREHWNQSVLLEVAAPAIDERALAEALALVLRHHPALRTRFVEGADGEWTQHYAEGKEVSAPLTVIDLGGVERGELSQAIERAAAQAQTGLDLEGGRLLRAALLRCGVGEAARLLIVIHHLVVDGVSWRVLLEDWQSAYEQLAGGRGADEVELAREVTSFAEWAGRLEEFGRSEEVRAERDYWLGIDGAFRLPVEFEGGENLERDAAHVTLSLSEEETRALLREVPAAYHTEVNDVLLCALGRALWRWTGCVRPVVELEGHGREEFAAGLDTSRTVGWFTTLFPVELEAGRGVGEDLKGVKERLRRVPRRGLGYGLLRYVGGPDEEVARTAALSPEVLFNYLGQLDGAVSGESIFRAGRESAGAARWGGGERSHLLTVGASVVGGRLRVSWGYGGKLHGRETIERAAGWMMEELRAIVAHCRAEGAGGYTPSDFPAAGLSQEELDDFIASVG